MASLSFHFLPECLSILTLLFCFISIISALKFFGKAGLYVYSTIAAIASNIQVLKITQYSFVTDPVALGTVLFSTTFAVDNILTEYYGTKVAKKNLYISFFGYLFFVVIMQIAILHPQVHDTHCVNLHLELMKIFSPSFYIFMSSLIAFFVGQYTDILVFSQLKKVYKEKWLIGRSAFSMAIASFADNFVFSFLAWIVFAENPVSMAVLWKTYIFIAYLLRLIIAVMCLPLVKSAGKFVYEGCNVQ